MDTKGLDIVLTCLKEDFKEDRAEATVELNKAQATKKRLDAVESRIDALKAHLPSQISSPSKLLHPQLKAVSTRPSIHRRDWATICEESRTRLCERGVDPEKVSLDALLDSEEVKRIENRFQGGFTLSTRLDCYDIVVAAVAGLTAALVDFLIVKIPKNMQYLGRFSEGSSLTKWIHSLSIHSDNWLAYHFKTSYDKVKEVSSEISGFNPRTHRFQTFGHDPLIGLVVGTIDIIRGGLTAISKEGNIIFLSDTGTAYYNPLAAIVRQIMHLMSDGFTPMGLPVPGWPLLLRFQEGSFTENEQTIAEMAIDMYKKGYDSRHFLTMGTSVAAAEVILRGYFWIRRKLDEKYDSDVALEAEVVKAEYTGDHPRFQAMVLAAHTTAVAANAGKVAISGNPLAINYAQWLRFFQAVFVWMRTKMLSPTNIIAGHAHANWKALEQGWPIIDVSDPSFPTLVVNKE